MSGNAYETAAKTWLSEIQSIQKFTNEFGCVCNEIIFTSKMGGKLSLTLFDVKPLDKSNLNEIFYLAAEETLRGVPSGFPMIYSIMYTNEACEKFGVKPEQGEI